MDRVLYIPVFQKPALAAIITWVNDIPCMLYKHVQHLSFPRTPDGCVEGLAHEAAPSLRHQNAIDIATRPGVGQTCG